ncbi:MAG: LptF/LptG family permease [Owenweeksia sp.]|nr:LptF/LptG family permease [Owenweeksia sp.]
MLRTIDRYIIKKFLGTFFLTITLILAIAIVFDISEKIEDFLTRGASFSEIVFDYYFNFIVFYGNLFNSMIVFIAVIFFTSRMTANTEVVAILTGGVSFRRMMWPYFVAATLLAGISYVLGHYVIPISNVERISFQNSYINHHGPDRFKNIHRQIKPDHIIYFENYNGDRNSGYHFSYEVFEDEVMRSKLKADFIRLDTNTGKWVLDNYSIRILQPDGTEKIRSGRQMDTLLDFKPKEIVPKLYTVEMMKTPELNDFIKKEKLRGSENINFYLIEKYRRTSWPIATYVLTLIGVSISSKKTRGGLGLNIAIGLIICVTYIFFMQISTTFATIGNFSPLLAVWFPNIIFSVVAIYLYYIAPK